MNADKFYKRSGTTDQGKDYENLLVAYYSFKLVQNDEVADFKISSNDDQHGSFDDLVIEINWRNGISERFNIQAKHKQTNKNKNLLLEALRAEKGRFSVKKRMEEFTSRPNENSKCCLFTNRKLEVKGEEELIYDSSYVICISDQTHGEFINTNVKQSGVYRFNITENNEAKKDLSKLQEIQRYRHFFKSFYLYTNQKNVNEIRDTVSTLFQENFKSGSSAIKNYLDFVITWSNKDGKKDKLTKQSVRLKIVECLLSPCILALPEGKISKKSRLFKEVIDAFEITIISDFKKENNFYMLNTIDTNLEELNKTGLTYQILSKYVKNISELSKLQLAVILWFLNVCPLVLKVTSSNENLVSLAINLCKGSEPKKRFILVGSKKQWHGWKTFQNLSDVFNNHKEIYDEIVTTFGCSFNGQREGCLKEIINDDEKIRNAFRTDELILMTECNVNFGCPKETLQDFYIERRLTKITIDYDFIEKFAETEPIVISCNGKINILKTRLQDLNYLEIDESPEMLNSPQDSSTQFFTTNIVYVSNKECPREEFEKICEKHPSRDCHHFRIDAKNNLEWLESSKSIENLKNFQTQKDYFVEEKVIPDRYRLNMICADAGMGKSTMILNIKNNYSSKFWVIKIVLREYTTFFEKCDDFQKFMDHLTGRLKLTESENRIFDSFREANKLVFIWDGIDEIAEEVLNNVLEVIDKMRKQEFVQWITARSSLKKKLEEKFDTFARRIKPFGRKDQKLYLAQRLRFMSDFEKISEQILEKMDNEHLRVPLQIFMLTELCIHNENLCRNFLTYSFSVTDLFEYFIEEKFNFYYRKANIDLNNNVARQILLEHKEQRLALYEMFALKLYLQPKILKTLNLPKIDNFVLKIQTEDDSFGILEVINGLANFAHRTYAEYFVALWLSKNYRKVTNLEDFFFCESFKGTRFMFDLILAKGCPLHIAVLYKSVEGIRKNLDKIHLQDKAGRNPLHIASSWGQAHPILSTKNKGNIVICTEKGGAINKEDPNQREIMELLVPRCNIKQKDNLFQFDCLQYADQFLSLTSIDVISTKDNLDFSQLKHFASLESTLYYIIKFDYKNLFEKIPQVPYVEISTGGSLLHLCAVFNRQHFLAKLLKNKMYARSINQKDQRKWSPLHHASCHGHTEIIKMLKGVGGDIYLGRRNGEDTPLYVAAQYGQLEVLTYLLESKTDVNTAKQNGWTPLMVACQKQNLQVIRLLVDHKAKINITNNEGYTSLYIAARKGDLEIVKYLVSKGANVNLVGRNGEGPLYIAAKLVHLHITKFLIHNGANVNAIKTTGWTPLMIAIRYGHLSVVRVLLQNGARCDTSFTVGSLMNPMAWTRESSNPLKIAAERGHLQIAQLLLQYGAKLNLDFTTSLHKAALCGHLQMVELLMKHGAEVKLDTVRLVAENGYSNIAELLMKKLKNSDKVKLSIITESKKSKHEETKINMVSVNRTKRWLIIFVLVVLVVVLVFNTSLYINYLIRAEDIK